MQTIQVCKLTSTKYCTPRYGWMLAEKLKDGIYLFVRCTKSGNFAEQFANKGWQSMYVVGYNSDKTALIVAESLESCKEQERIEKRRNMGLVAAANCLDGYEERSLLNCNEVFNRYRQRIADALAATCG